MIPKLNTLQVQEGKLGRPFRCSIVSIVPNTEKWIKRTLKHHWLHVFKYIDDGSLFAIELDYNDNIVKVIKNYEL